MSAPVKLKHAICTMIWIWFVTTCTKGICTLTK